jgi:hypothetical protein
VITEVRKLEQVNEAFAEVEILTQRKFGPLSLTTHWPRAGMTLFFAT